MKAVTTMTIAAMVAVGMGQTTGSGGYGYNSPFSSLYRRSTQMTFSGRVTGKIKGTPKKGMAELVTILVRIAKHKVVTVDLGPDWFVASQAAKINMGDPVRVTGSQVHMGALTVILASKVVDRKHLLALRDASGSPFWVAKRPRIASSASPANGVTGSVIGQNTVTINNQPYVAYQVQTNDGVMDVVTAPDWYWNRQDYALHPGDGITVLGNAAPIQVGPHVFVADSFYSGSNTFVLRNNGIPVWNGWGGG